MATEKGVLDTKIETTITTSSNGHEKRDRPTQSFPQMSHVNPYTLLPSETPGALLIHIKLKGNNCDQWSLLFISSLRAKWKDCSLEYADSTTMNTLILFWSFTTLDSSLLPYV